jgi:hypothetical protein
MLLTVGLIAERESHEPVPVLLSLSSWRPGEGGEHLQGWVARRLAEDYPFLADVGAYGQHAAVGLVLSGRVLPVVDGLDELPEALHVTAVDELDLALADGMPLVVTCRGKEFGDAVHDSGRVLGTAAVVELDRSQRERHPLSLSQLIGACRQSAHPKPDPEQGLARIVDRRPS